MVNGYLWEALCFCQGLTPERWALEKPFVRRYLRGWPQWSPERRAMAKEGVLQARDENVAKGVPGWR